VRQKLQIRGELTSGVDIYRLQFLHGTAKNLIIVLDLFIALVVVDINMNQFVLKINRSSFRKFSTINKIIQ